MTTLSMGLWTLPDHVGASRGALNALRREFARLRALEHPHIARLLELGSNGQHYYVRGEHLDGESLREVLTHLLPERLDVKDADEVVRAIGSALIYAHEQGIAHGDVRAENVLVTMDQRFVLTNFLARRIAKVTARPPRPGDDLRGLARLAAELYVGSSAPQALRDGIQDGIPAQRLHAIRSVLESTGRRPNDVAAFLAAAGLTPLPQSSPPPAPAPAASAEQTATVRRAKPRKTRRRWSFWRFALSLAAGLAIGTALASYGGRWRASVDEIETRGRDALRAVAARIAPAPAPLARPSLPAAPSATPSAAAVPVADPVLTPAPPNDSAAANVEAPPAAPPEAPLAAKSNAQRTPPVFSLGIARIAAREDHSVVAIDIVRTGDSSRAATIDWWITPGTAYEDEDYVMAGRQTVAIPAGEAVGRILIPIVNDGVPELDETFTVHLARPRGTAAGAISTTEVTLHDDD